MKVKSCLKKVFCAHKGMVVIYIFSLSMLSTVLAHAGRGPYFTSNKYVTQNPYKKLCWAASSVSMLQTKGVSTNVKTHTTKALGSFKDVTRQSKDMVTDFRNIYKINTTRVNGKMSLSSIEASIRANKPILALMYSKSGAGHAVVISGTDSSVKSLRIMDPLYGWQYPSYDEFTHNYLGAAEWKKYIKFN